jgi:hypothetical protein
MSKYKYRSNLIEELWKEKTKFYKELNIIMLKKIILKNMVLLKENNFLFFNFLENCPSI